MTLLCTFISIRADILELVCLDSYMVASDDPPMSTVKGMEEEVRASSKGNINVVYCMDLEFDG